jgi:hypothetical protein
MHLKDLGYGPICYQDIFFLIGKLHTIAVGFKNHLPSMPSLRGGGSAI